MAEKLMVRTDLLDRCASELNSAAIGFGDAASILASLNTNQEWWQKIGGFSTLRLQDEGSSTSMGTAANTAQMIAAALRRYDHRTVKLGNSVTRAAQLFRETENQLSCRIDSQGTGTERAITPGNGAEAGVVTDGTLSNEEEIRWREEWLVRIAENALLHDYVQSYYDKLDFFGVTIAGILYNTIQMKTEDILMADYNAGVDMVDNILDRYVNGVLDDLNSVAGDVKDAIKKGTGLYDNWEQSTLLNMDEVQRKLYEMEKENPSLRNAETSDILKGLKGLADTAENVERISRAIDRFQKMMRMDKETAMSLVRGMQASGDVSAQVASWGLSCVGDPAQCLAYCVAVEGIDFGVGEAADAARKGIEKSVLASPYAPIAVSKNITTFAVENTMNTSKTISAVNYSETVNRMRGNTREALSNAIAAYKKNPTSENASKVADLYKTYNTQGAEQLSAVKKISQTLDDSLLGKITNGNKNENLRNQLDSLAQQTLDNNKLVTDIEKEIQSLKG